MHVVHTAAAVGTAVDIAEPEALAPTASEALRCALVRDLQDVRKSMRAAEAKRVALNPRAGPSERNLAHYLAFRRHDHRDLQERLSEMGLSSLGRAETHMLANVDQVLQRLGGAGARADLAPPLPDRTGYRRGQALQQQHTEALFGPAPTGRRSYIMVTLPSEAATDAALIPSLVRSGMDLARINCAHDDAEAWIAMATRVRSAAQACGRPVRILMDLAGPKLRTGPVAPGPQVLKLKPTRDAYGVVTSPARLLLRPRCSIANDTFAGSTLELDARWLSQLQQGDSIRLIDARGRKRRLQVVDLQALGAVVHCERTAYIRPGTRLVVHPAHGSSSATEVRDLPTRPGHLHLQRGQTLRLTAQGIGQDAQAGGAEGRKTPATIACTLPEVLTQLREGERIWFDDGRIGGVIRRVSNHRADIEITEAGPDGEVLAADKGINLPDSRIELPALTDKDIEDLAVVARHADMVGLSFVQSAADVQALHRRLAALCANRLGVVLKIETRRGFENLPELLFAAMNGGPAGVMIARGDLAVECGFERLAELQEEMLWVCEAAHMPVVWATQVLENLAKTGRPSRAEITDAAMGVRADCVMLNKGPHILEAMHMLDDILRRMQDHQSKKRSLLRALKAWG
jgi:pyruvate kinase